jgi:hypothetical protein
VNGDNYVTPSDVLIVINHLNSAPEGEAARDVFFGDLSIQNDLDDDEKLLQLMLDAYNLAEDLT